MAVFMILGGLLAAAVASIFVDDCEAWLDWLTYFVLDRAVQRLPKRSRARYAEEWRSHVSEIPGRIGKLVAAVSLLWAAHRMSPCLSSDPVLSQQELQEQTRKMLALLTPREEQVVRMRFGIGQKAKYTQEEVAQQFAITPERIFEIEELALRKMRLTRKASPEPDEEKDV